ncbi:MAG: IPT/TIG domain-containing protein [Acidobacteriota bacterium]
MAYRFQKHKWVSIICLIMLIMEFVVVLPQPALAAPIVTAISEPSSGKLSVSGITEMTITGTGFSVATKPTVRFYFYGGTSADVQAYRGSATEISVIAPAKAAGTKLVAIDVINADLTVGYFQCTPNLLYINDPIASNIFLRTEVTVTHPGFNYAPIAPIPDVYIEGPALSNAEIVEVIKGTDIDPTETITLQAYQIGNNQIHIPYNSSYMNDNAVKFKITNVAGAVYTSSLIDLGAVIIPKVTGFTDANIDDLIEGQPLTLQGTGFNPTSNLNKVIVNSSTAAGVTTNVYGTVLEIPSIPNVGSPQGTARDMTIDSYVAGGVYRKSEAVYKTALKVYPRPANLTLYSPIMPNKGKVAGGSDILLCIQGYDQSTTQIIFGGIPATVYSPYTDPIPTYYGWPSGPDIKVIKVQAPAHTEGTVDIRVQNARYPTLIYSVASHAFTYSGEGQFLQVTDASPLTGNCAGGYPVQIQSNFVKLRSNDNSITSLVYIPDGSYVGGQVYGTPFPITRDSNGNFNLSTINIANGKSLFIREQYNNYDIDGTSVTFVVYSQVKVIFGSPEAKITGFQNGTNPQRQFLIVTAPQYTLAEGQLSQAVDVKVELFEFMFRDGMQFTGPASDPSFTGFDTINTPPETPSRLFIYTRNLTDPEISAVTPSQITWKDVGKPRQLVIQGWDFYKNLRVDFLDSLGNVVGTITDNGSNMTIVNGALVNGRVQSTLTLPDPPDINAFNTGIGQVRVRITNWDTQAYTYVTPLVLTSAPDIDRAIPANGADRGGQIMMIEGSDFYYNPEIMLKATGIPNVVYGTNVVVLDANMTPLTSASTTAGVYAIFDAPAISNLIWTLPDNFDITITNTDTGAYTASDIFTAQIEPGVGNRPQISGMTPTQGLIAGGTNVSINGSGFKANATVTIDGMELTDKLITNTTITGKTPKGHRINVRVPVQVVNTDGGFARRDDLFMYYEQTSNPTITSISPTHGTAGIKVIIKGSEFSTRDLVDSVYLPCAVVTVNHSVYGQYVFDMVYNPVFGGNASTDMGKAYVADSNTIELIMPEFLVGGISRAGVCTIQVKNRDNVTVTAAQSFSFQVPLSTPSISDVTPTFGAVSGGNIVTIQGDGFLQDDFEVYFGSKLATIVNPVSQVTGQVYYQLQVSTPPASIGGLVDVTVMNYDGGYETLTNGFTYTDTNYLPVITSMSKVTGPASGGQAITIKGRNFQPVSVVNSVYYPLITFAGSPAVYNTATYRVDSETLLVTTPPYSGAGRVDVVITNPDGGSAKTTYTYTQSQPTIASMFPDNRINKKAPTYKVIKGTNFLTPQVYNGQTIRTRAYLLYPAGSDEPTREIEVTDGTTQLQVTDGVYQTVNNIDVVSTSEMHVVFPSLLATDRTGSWTLRLVNPDGGKIDYAVTVISIDPGDLPKVTLPLDPAEGSIKGSTLVAINGANFQTGVAVTFNAKACTATTPNTAGTQIVATTPAGTDPDDVDRAVDITIVNADGGQLYLFGAYTYRLPESSPTITAITPAEGPSKGGTQVTITGTAFKTGCKVFFDTTELTNVTRVSTTTIQIVTPKHALGAVDVTVRNPDLGEAKKDNGFTYTGSPEIDEGSFTARIVNSAIVLNWPLLNGATSYEITVSIGNSSSWTFLTNSTETQYIMKNIKANSYYFRLRTVNGQGVSMMVNCNPFPLIVKSTDLAEQPPTGQVQEYSDNITYSSDGRLQIVIGKDLIYIRDQLYPVTLTDDQQKATSVEVLIPINGINQAYNKTVTITTDNFILSIPLNSLRTFEYQKYSNNTDDTYVRIALDRAPSARLESASLNSGRKALTGFNIIASIKEPHNQNNMSYFNSTVGVYWPVGEQFGLPIAAYMDPVTRKWVRVPTSVDPLTGMVSVNTLKPTTIVFFVPQLTR